MSSRLAKCIRQVLRRWRQKGVGVPSDVPEGHVAVSVGSSGRRFIVPATHLNHPVFRRLLGRAEEVHGFANRGGPLAIPCDVLIFQDILRFLDGYGSGSSRSVRRDPGDVYCHVAVPGVDRNGKRMCVELC